MYKILHQNIDSVCRSCLIVFKKNRIKKYNIFNTPVIHQWFLEFDSDSIKPNDGLPNYLCLECYFKILDFLKFREVTKRSKRVLAALLAVEKEKASGDGKKLESPASSPKLTGHIKSKSMFDISFTSTYDSQDYAIVPYVKGPEIHANKVNGILTSLLDTNSSFVDVSKIQRNADTRETLNGLRKNVRCFPAITARDIINKDTNLKSNISTISDITDESDDYSAPSIAKTQINSMKSILRNNSTNKDNNMFNAVVTNTKLPARLLKNSTNKTILRRKYKCPECSRLCTSQTSFIAHQRMHKFIKTYRCTECNATFYRLSRLHEHMKDKHEPKEFKYACPYEGCSKTFRREANCRQHYQIKHAGARLTSKTTHLCEECGRTFKNGNVLKQHLFKHKPKDEYPFQCDKCSNYYSSINDFHEHLLSHAGYKKLECHYCSMKQNTRNELRNHLELHAQERQWPCAVCSVVFKSAAMLGRHVRTMHQDRNVIKAGDKPKLQKCDICNKRFGNVLKFREHLKSHLIQPQLKTDTFLGKRKQQWAMRQQQMDATKHYSSTEKIFTEDEDACAILLKTLIGV